jgi:hypothetical protein
MKKLFITLGLITCLFASGQNIMQLSSSYVTDELNIETVEGAVSQAIIDTLYKYKDDINDNNHTKITAIVNTDLSNLLTKCLNRNFDDLTDLHIAFAQVVLFHKEDIPELAIRLHNQVLINNDNYIYERGDNCTAWDIKWNTWRTGVIEFVVDDYIYIEHNKGIMKCNYYLTK